MAGQLDGQLWFVIQGGINDIIDGHVNSDGSNITTTHLNPVATPGTGFQQGGSDLSIGFDLPNGLFFVVNSDGLSISVHSITTGTLIDTLQIGDFNGSTANQDIVNSLVVDPNSHTVYVGRWGETKAESGIVAVSYTTAGDLANNQAYDGGDGAGGADQVRLVNGNQAGGITDVRYMDLSNNNQFLYYTDNDNQYSFAPFSPTNAIFRIDLSNPGAGATKLSDQIQFPTNESNGYIGSVTADEEDGIIYFTTHQKNAGGASTGQDALWWMPIGGGTATKITLPPGALHYAGEWGGLSYDRQTGQLYISDEDPTAGGLVGRHIIQLQMSADGKSVTSVVNTFTVDQLVGHTADPNAYPLGTSFDLLPAITVTGTATHAGEQGATIDLTGAVSTSVADADNNVLASATVQITGGTFSSNETSANDDHLTVNDSGTFKTTGTFTGTNITISYDSATEKLTLSGVDTFAHYQTVLNAVSYNTTGDNPTNYGNNTTRTVTWTLSDGAPNVPFGGQNSTTTTLTIDAVNDAPAFGALGSQTFNEDVLTAFSGVAAQLVTDVDANPASQNIIVALSVLHGTLTVGASGATVVGNGTNTVTFTGTQNQINTTLAAVNGLKYQSILNYNGPDTLTITANDQGFTGSGGALQVSKTVGITVTAVDDAPVNTVPGAQSVNEDTNLVFNSANGNLITVADVDVNETASPNNTVQVTVSAAHGVLTLGSTTNLSFSAGDGTADATMTFTATLSDINNALNGLTYRGNLNFNGTNEQLSITTGDLGHTGSGGPLSDTDTVAINVSAVNDAPVTSPSSGATASLTAINEDTAAPTGQTVAAIIGSVFSDAADNQTANGGSSANTLAGIAIISNAATSEGIWQYSTNSGSNWTTISSSTNATTALLIAANANTLIRFVPALDFNGPAPALTAELIDSSGGVVTTGNTANLSLPASSGGSTQYSAATVTISETINPVNDPPVVDLNGGGAGNDATAAFTEQTPLAIIPSATIADVDSANMASITATLTARPDGNTVESLSLNSAAQTAAAGLVVSYTQASGILSITGSASRATYQTILDGIQYNNTSDTPTTTNRTVTVVVNDGADNSTSHSVTVSVAAVNDAPVVDLNGPGGGNDATAAFTEQTLLVIAPSATIVDVDSATIASLTATLTARPDGDGVESLSLNSAAATAAAGLVVSYTAATGILSITGSASKANYQTILDGIQYNNTSDTPTTTNRTVNVVVNDGADNSTSHSVTISVAAVNDAPVVDLDSGTAGNDATAAFTEQTPILIAPSATVADVDSANIASLTATLALRPDGDGVESLSLNSAAVTAATGLVVNYTASSGVLSITGSASKATYQTILEGIQYNNTSDTPTTTNRTVNVVVNDGTDNSTSHSVTVSVTAVNDAPVVDLDSGTAGNDATAAFTEQTLLVIAPSATIVDVDSATIASLTATLTARPDGDGVESLSLNSAAVTAAAGLVVTYTASSGVLSITGSASKANYQTILDGIQYNNTSDTPTTTNRTVNVVVNDGADNSTSHSVTVSVAAVNDAPVVDLDSGTAGNDATAAFTEQTPLVIAPAATITDADNANLTSLTATLTARPDGNPVESLSLNSTAQTAAAGLTVSYTQTSGVLSITGSASKATYQTILDGIQYNNTSDTPTTTNRTVSVVASDGTDPSTSHDVVISVAAVNDAPVVTVAASVSAGPNSTVTLSPAANVTDVDSADLAGATVSVSGSFAASGDDLIVDPLVFTQTAGLIDGTNIHVARTTDANDNVTLTFSGSDTLANYKAVFDAIQFTAGATPTNGGANPTRTVTWVADDGSGSSNLSTPQATLVTLGQPPQLTIGNPTAADFTENAGAVPLLPAALITDSDGPPPASTQATKATVTISGGFTTGDVLAADNTGAPGITVSYSNGVLTLSGNGTLVDYETVLDTVTFNNTGENPSNADANLTRTISWVVKDNDGIPSAAQTTSINIAAINDAPTIGAPVSIAVTEDVTTALTGISFADVDAGAGAVTVTLSVASGTLAATSSGTVTVGGSSSAMTLAGSIANINAFIVASNVTYTTALNGSSDVTLNVAIDDGGHSGADPGVSGTGTGTSEAASTQVTLAVTAVNDAPTIVAPASIAIPEDTGTALIGISFNDVDAGGDAVTVTLGVASGALAATSSGTVTVGGSSTAMTLLGSFAEINAFIAGSGVTYTTALNATSNVTLNISIDDGDHNGTGGAKTASTTTTLAVAPVNDAPTIGAPASIGVTEDVSSAVTGITFADVDAGAAAVTVTLSVASGALAATSSGTVTVGGSASAMTLAGSIPDINAFIAASKVTYTTAANATADVTLNIAIDDNGNTGTDPGGSGTANSEAAATTTTLTVTAVNDPPVANADTGSAGENETKSFDVVANDTDVDIGDSQTLVALGAITVTSANGDVNAINAAGAFSIASNKVLFTPGTLFDKLDFNDTATVVVNYTMQDSQAVQSSSTLTLTVNGANDAPTANADTGFAGENEIKSFDVVGNDTEVDTGDAKTLASLGVVTVTSANGDVNNIAAAGAFSIVGNQIQFSPTTLFDKLDFDDTATVVVNYTMHDGQNASSSSTLTLTVNGVNDAPAANVDTGFAGENETKSFNVVGNDTDVDTGDTQTLAAIGVVAVTSANADVNGINAAGAFSIVGNQIQFVPGTLFDKLDFNDTATVVVNYTMHDSQNAASSSTLTLTVNGANDAPVANPDTGSAGENETKSFDVVANDTEVDTGDTKTLASLGTVTVTSANAAINGIDASATFAVVGNQVQFTPGTLFDHLAAGDTASVVVNYTMHDGQNASSSSALTLTVNGVNDAPTLANVATSAAYPPGGAPVVLAPALTIGDVDSATLSGATVHISSATTFLGDVLAANGQTNGAVPGHPAINAVYNPGNATLTLTGVASLAEYQDVLQHVTFQSTNATPTNGGANADRVVDWQVNDGSGVNNLSNVPKTDISLHTLDLDADDSTVSGTGYATTFTEKGPAVPIAGNDPNPNSDVTINDADSTVMQSATITLNNHKAFDLLSVNGPLPAGITASSYDSGTGVLKLTTTSGAPSATDYQTALHQVVFSNSSGNPDTTNRDITIVVRDSLNIDTNPAHATVAVIAVDDKPVLDAHSGAPGGSLTFTENNAATAIDAVLTVTDVDSANLSGASVSITGNFHTGEDVLGFVNQNGITGNYDSGTGVLTLSGTSSVANYQAALRSVSYFNGSENPSGDVRTISYQSTDDAAVASDVVTTTVAVIPVNDAATITGTTSGTVVEAGGVANGTTNTPTASADLLASDVDNTADAWQLVAPGAATTNGYGTYGVTAAGVWTYTLDNNNATVQAASTPLNDSFTVLTQDGTSQLISITINNANDAPVFTNLGGVHPSFVENGSSVVLDNDVTVGDPELNAAGNYGGATLTLARNGGANPDDTFAGTGSLDLTHSNGSGENVSLNNGATFIGTATQPGDGTFSITFNASATAANVASVMQQIVYANASDNPEASVQINWSFSDGNTGVQGSGGAGVATGSVTVDITQVDDAPALINVAPSAAYMPGTAGAVLSSGLGIFDPDAVAPSPLQGLASATIKIESGFFAGDELFVNLATSGGHFVTPDGDPTNISVQSNVLGTLTLSGNDTVSHYQSVLDAVSYHSTATDPSNGGANPTRNISWQVNDGALNSQTPNPDPNNLVNETVLHFDVAPAVDLDASGAGTGFTTTFTENGAPIAIVDTDVSIVDPDNANLDAATIVLTNAKATDALSIVGALPGGIDSSIDTSVPGQITLHLRNSASLADYQTALGQVRFVNSSDAPNTTDRDITVFVTNSADSNVVHATIHVISVNDAPVAANSSASGSEDTSISGVVSATDVDNAPAQLSYSLVGTNGGAAHGTVVFHADGSYTYSPVHDFNGSDSFSFKANDGSLDSNVATVSLTVSPVNDAPVAANGSASGNEDTPIAGAVSASDVDNTPAQLSYVLVGANGGATHGTVVLHADGTFAYTPASNFNGSDSFSFKTNDGALDSNVAIESLTINAVNDAPVNTVPGALSVDSGLDAAITGLAVSDVDAVSLTTSLHVEHGTLTVAAVSGAAVVGSGTGTVTLSGSVAQIDATLGAANNVLYHSAFNFGGTDHLTMTTSDGGGTGSGGPQTDIDIVDILVGFSNAPPHLPFSGGGGSGAGSATNFNSAFSGLAGADDGFPLTPSFTPSITDTSHVADANFNSAFSGLAGAADGFPLTAGFTSSITDTSHAVDPSFAPPHLGSLDFHLT